MNFGNPWDFRPLSVVGGVFFSMMTHDSKELLRDFSRNRSEEAFRALVRQHSPVVYGTALRKLGGNRAAAQDVTQEVFTLLARKANRLESVVLGGWLYRQACRRAANHVRSESRRKRRESAAMESLAISTAPEVAESLTAELDNALLALPAEDRDALILRFFEGKEFKSLGSTLGLSEEAARKRVTRALERLGGNLKRKGIATGSLSLGQTMSGFGETEIPSNLASRVTKQALRAGAASAFAPALSFIMPLAAGVIVTSLIAGSLPSSLASTPPPTVTPTATGERRNAKSSESPQDLSLEEMIVGLRRVLSKPSHSLTSLQLGVMLEGIGFARIPEFIRLANDRMTPAERVSIYPRLLEKWLAADPKAAMDFVLLENIGKQVDPHHTTNLLNNLFESWVRKDRGASESWLLENWGNPVLREKAFEDTLRNFLMVKLVDERFAHEGVASVFELIHQLPATDQTAALDGIAGKNTRTASWQRGDPRKWIEVHHALKGLPDARLGRELMRSFWAKLSRERPDDVIGIQNTMDPSDRFDVSLGWLGVTTRPGEHTRLLSGFSVASTPVTDQDQREAAALAAGLAAGFSRDQAMGEIGRVLIETRGREEFFKWFDSQPDGMDIDDTLSAKARELAYSSGWTHGQEMIAVDWARRISNDGLRLQLCRGAFRKGMARTPDAALAYLKSEGLPPDLAAEFQSILNEAP